MQFIFDIITVQVAAKGGTRLAYWGVGLTRKSMMHSSQRGCDQSARQGQWFKVHVHVHQVPLMLLHGRNGIRWCHDEADCWQLSIEISCRAACAPQLDRKIHLASMQNQLVCDN